MGYLNLDESVYLSLLYLEPEAQILLNTNIDNQY